MHLKGTCLCFHLLIFIFIFIIYFLNIIFIIFQSSDQLAVVLLLLL